MRRCVVTLCLVFAAACGARLVQPTSERSVILTSSTADAAAALTSAAPLLSSLSTVAPCWKAPRDGTRGTVLGGLLCLRGGASWKDWAYKTLAKLGIFLKKGRLLVLGLDNAGKSTLLTVLLRNEVVPTAPTHQPVTDMIKIGHMKLRAVDMGGHEIARRMWVQYAHEADGIVYIVDAADRERFGEAAIELHKLLASPTLPPNAAVLVLANKCDLPHAAQQEELYYALGLDELAQAGSSRPIGLYLCSIFERRGYMEGFDWLGTHI